MVSTTDASDAQSDAADPLATGLVAYWKLDEMSPSDVVVDSSGRGHSGMSVNGPLPSTSTPPIPSSGGASRSFDGVSQYIVIPQNPEMNFSGPATLAAWVNIAATTAGCHYFVSHGYCQIPPGEIALRLGAPGCGPGTLDHYWAVGSWLSAEHSAIAPLSSLDYNVWVHIAGTYDGQAWHLYKNGVEIGTQASTVGAVPVEADWWIGARGMANPPCVPSAAMRFFDGLIAEVRVYNRALSPSEMLELYRR